MAAGEIAAALGLRENSAHHHLIALERDGLAAGEAERTGHRGRPRRRYRARPVSGPYERLALALLRARRTGESLADAGRAVAPDGDDVVAFLTAEGFDPQLDEDGIVLRQCPLSAAVQLDPGAVCEVHRGLVTAIAARSGGTLTLVASTPGQCRVH
jgi:predicted ArsR family transcriptional regulator